jgi:predicted NACHT family NTPase
VTPDQARVSSRAGAWRPKKQTLLDWLAQQLATDYGWLTVSHARALVARGMVLPILDGLDEMPSGQQRAAIARINKHDIYRPLILTSREREYHPATAGHGADIKHAAVVAVQPPAPRRCP